MVLAYLTLWKYRDNSFFLNLKQIIQISLKNEQILLWIIKHIELRSKTNITKK